MFERQLTTHACMGNHGNLMLRIRYDDWYLENSHHFMTNMLSSNFSFPLIFIYFEPTIRSTIIHPQVRKQFQWYSKSNFTMQALLQVRHISLWECCTCTALLCLVKQIAATCPGCVIFVLIVALIRVSLQYITIVRCINQRAIVRW